MDIRIQVMHAGDVCVAPALPFGGEDAGPLATSGLFTHQDDRLWLPVFAYLIDHPRGFVLVDTGWSRSMSPGGRYSKQAQVESLGSRLLFRVNQGVVDAGQTVPEQLAARDLSPKDLACVLLTHLDCDHANGLDGVAGAQRILVSRDELESVRENAVARIRYQSRWWEGVNLKAFDWNGDEGPHGRSFDLFGDGSIVCIALPGHSRGLFAVKVTGEDGRFALLCSDAAYGPRSWCDMVLSGVATDRDAQRASLRWVREQSEDPLCVEVLASHDAACKPHEVELRGLPAPIVPAAARAVEPAGESEGEGLVPEAVRRTAGTAAVAAMLATTLSAAPLNHSDFPLPEATPIVQVIDLGNHATLDTPPDDQHHDSKSSVWKKIMKLLKYALLALALVAAFALAAVNGCSSCAAGPLAAPVTADESSESTSASEESSESASAAGESSESASAAGESSESASAAGESSESASAAGESPESTSASESKSEQESTNISENRGQ